uniref:Max dimerization protein 3 n=1 Tax=Crocodylus porosus TaxID=8502 RepID=A0A7M4F997_CROPO
AQAGRGALLPGHGLWGRQAGHHGACSLQRAQLRRCLQQLRQQVPGAEESSRHTTLSLLHWARLHIQKLEEQEQGAQRLKDRLQREQRSLQRRLEQLVPGAGGERTRANSLDSSALSSERSDSDHGQWQRGPAPLPPPGRHLPQHLRAPGPLRGGLSRASPTPALLAGPVKTLPPLTEDAEINVEMTVFDSSEGDVLARFSAGREHSYSSIHRTWL